MAEEQIRQAYNQLYSVEDDNKKRSVLEQLRTEAEQLGLRDWVRLIEARLALTNDQYDIAIDLSNSLLDRPELTSELRAMALYNRGFTYARLEPPRTEDAIADYTAVIEMPDAPPDQKAMALVNRGVTYGQLEPPRTEDAIADYTAVIEMPDAPADQKAAALFLRGITYKQKSEPDKAKADLLEAKKAHEQIGDKDTLKSIDFLLSRLDVDSKDLSQQDKEIIQAVSSAPATEKQLSVEDKIITAFTAKKTTVYDKYNRRSSSTYTKDTNAENEVILAILKGWGSAVPLVLGGEGACRGGGYFLKFNGHGLAVDPGHDFLTNFHDQKFHLRELDGVLVSHNHPDHTHDLKSIDDVKYEMWVSSGGKSQPYSLVLDNDTAGSIEEWTREAKDYRKPPFRVDANRHDKVDLIKEAGLPFNVESFKVEHTKNVPNAVGYRVSCMKEQKPVLTVGFSCDTKYFPELCDDDNLGGCDILVAHMSQPEIPELKDPVNAKFKEGHLGYRGTIELVKGCKPKLTIISEFWAGLDDARILLLQGLRNRCKTNNILPGGVGLLVKVTFESKCFQILCTNCKKWTHHEKIKVGSSSVPFGPLNYLCPDCHL